MLDDRTTQQELASYHCPACDWDSRYSNSLGGCPHCLRERLKRGQPAPPPRHEVREDDGRPDGPGAG